MVYERVTTTSPATCASASTVTSSTLIRGSQSSTAWRTATATWVLNPVLMPRKTRRQTLQPYSGSMMRSPGEVEKRIHRLSRMSTSSLAMSTLAMPREKVGGKLQPVPRKDFMSSADHDRRKAEQDGAAVRRLVAHAGGGHVEDLHRGRAFDNGVRRPHADCQVAHLGRRQAANQHGGSAGAGDGPADVRNGRHARRAQRALVEVGEAGGGRH